MMCALVPLIPKAETPVGEVLLQVSGLRRKDEFRDVSFPAGTIVMVCAFTGNRDLADDARGPDGPDSFDIAAPRGRARELTFGAGVHYCVGANLARLELREALSFLAQRVSRLELDGDPEFESITGIYGLAELPVRLTL